ncbi:MAG: cytochrome c oxidase subunit II [Gemmatimonadales bacterium]|nr:MAG: cytochrome c oxidase subunit II [Gemmatimonadales bacterium]
MRVLPNWKSGVRPRVGAPLRALLPILLLALATGCGVEYPQSTIDPRSDFAEIIHGLYVSIFWWTMLILAVVWIALSWTLVKFRARPDDPKPKQIRGHLGLEIGWTVGPALIVVAIAIPTIQAVFATQRPLEGDPIVVEVTGHRFWWEFHYPEQGVTTANELWLPVDRPVSLRLGSVDVIHSFWVPLLGGKRDVNPVRAVREGQDPRYNWLYFTPNEPGLYMGQCAEFCGESHAFMSMRVNVVTEGDFDAWVAGWFDSSGAAIPGDPGVIEGADPEAGTAVGPRDDEVESGMATAQAGDAADDDLVATGRDIFLNQAACGACHAITGTAAQGDIGPNLTLFGLRTSLAAGIMENTPENLAAWIIDPERFKPGVNMPGTGYNMESRIVAGSPFFWPATGLDDEQVRAVSAYLLSLR